MRTICRVIAVALVGAAVSTAAAQTRRAPARPAPPPPAAPKREAPELKCPSPLGIGVSTKVSFCDVMTDEDPASGTLITLPPHKGPVTLTFNLHNRHTYSEEQIRAKRAFTRYTATIGVLTMDNTLISRAVVQNEFRTAADLVDRVGGGAGPAGVKAVAPTGSEPVSIEVPEGELQVSLLGEKLTVEDYEGARPFTQLGRPIAAISNVMLEYRPGPPPRATAKKRGR